MAVISKKDRNKKAASVKIISGKDCSIKVDAVKSKPADEKRLKKAESEKSSTGAKKTSTRNSDVLTGGSGNEYDLKPGTVIGVDRGLYKHYAIYAGRGFVIHYASATADFGDSMCVRKTGFKNFIKNALEFFICDFPDSHGRPLEKKKSADIFSPLTTGFGGGLFEGSKNPLTALLDIYELFKKISYRLYSPVETLRRAKSRLGESSYNLIFNNCEHFVVWCKTGVSESHQVNAVIRVITGSGEVIKTKP